jgi:hypothetical protein
VPKDDKPDSPKDDKPDTPKQSTTQLLGNAHTNTDLNVPLDIEAVAKELKLSAEQRAQFESQVKDVKSWLESDKERFAKFKLAPVEVLGERIPGIEKTIPKDLMAALEEGRDRPLGPALRGRAPFRRVQQLRA